MSPVLWYISRLLLSRKLWRHLWRRECMHISKYTQNTTAAHNLFFIISHVTSEWSPPPLLTTVQKKLACLFVCFFHCTSIVCTTTHWHSWMWSIRTIIPASWFWQKKNEDSKVTITQATKEKPLGPESMVAMATRLFTIQWKCLKMWTFFINERNRKPVGLLVRAEDLSFVCLFIYFCIYP